MKDVISIPNRATFIMYKTTLSRMCEMNSYMKVEFRAKANYVR